MAKIKKGVPASKKTTSATGFNFFSPFVVLPVLAMVTLAVYSACFDFTVTNWDDNHYIREVTLIRSLEWENIVRMFRTKVLLSYNPLVILSFAVDYAAGKNSAGWYHGTNVLLHIANSLLVYVVFRNLLRKDAQAALIAFLFALHPMHVESVAWIASRKDVLYTFFFLLSWWAYLGYSRPHGEHSEEKPAPARFFLYGASFLLFACSGFSKIQAVTLPLVFLLTDYFRNGRITLRDLPDKVPFLAGAAAFGWYAVSSSTLAADKYAMPVSFAEKIVYSFQAMSLYLVKAILPVNQTAIYAFPLKGTSEYWLTLLLGIAGSILLLALAVYWWKRQRALAFGAFFFLLSIFPTLHVVGVNSSLIYERFTYVSYLGLFLLLLRIPDIRPSLSKSIPVLLWLLVIPSAVLAYQRTLVWKTSETLWTDVISKNPRSHEALNNRGALYNERGELDRALADLDRSLELNPRQPRTLNNRTVVYWKKGNYEKAMADCDAALRLEPDFAEGWCNRGNIFFSRGQYDSAVVYYNRAIELMPSFPSAIANRGSCYLKTGDFKKAIVDYEAALSMQPGYVDAWRYGALAYAEDGNDAKANQFAQQAVSIQPGSDAFNLLANEYQAMGYRAFKNGDPALAIINYKKSVAIQPGNPDVWYEIGGMHYMQRDLLNARENWKKALQLKPDHANARMWLMRTGGI